MKKHTDESVKTGLQIEATGSVKKNNVDTSYKDAAKETDADDLVHEKDGEIDTANKEQDMDDLVHRSPVSKIVIDNEERDPDDLVHENEELSEE